MNSKQSRAMCNGHIGVDFKVAQDPAVWKTTKVTWIWTAVFRNPSSEALYLHWKSRLLLCVKVT